MELTWIYPLHGSAAIIAKTVVKTVDDAALGLASTGRAQGTT
jgi:hypothetical protein